METSTTLALEYYQHSYIVRLHSALLKATGCRAEIIKKLVNQIDLNVYIQFNAFQCACYRCGGEIEVFFLSTYFKEESLYREYIKLNLKFEKGLMERYISHSNNMQR